MRTLFLKTTFLFVLLLGSHLSQGQLFYKSSEFTRADSLRGTLTPLRTAYKIQKYTLDIEVFPEEKKIAGSNRIDFSANQYFTKIQIDLFENMEVDSIVFDKKNLSFIREHNAVFIEFPQIVSKGFSSYFTVYFSGHPVIAANAPWDGGIVWQKDTQGKDWIASAVQGMGASVWWPTKDHQSAKVKEVILAVTTPGNVENISNGRLIEKEKLANGKQKTTWKVTYPINNYNVALNIGDYVHHHAVYDGEEGKLDLDYFVLRENADKIEYLDKEARRTLEAFEYWFGPYPFYRDGYKLVETPYLGMEHQSAVAYGNKFAYGYLGGDRSGTGWGLKWDFIIVHESGHEWFGNNITAKDIGDMWIHEAFTSYSEALFVEYFYGKKAGQEYIYGTKRNIVNDKPVQGPYGVNTEGSADMYIKGAVMLNQVRTLLEDDEKWHALLRGLNQEFRYSTVDYEAVVNYIVRFTGINLHSFFQQYLQTNEVPTLEIRKKNGKIQGRWKTSISNLSMPVHLGEKDNLSLVWLDTEFKDLDLPDMNLEKLEIDQKNYYIHKKIPILS